MSVKTEQYRERLGDLAFDTFEQSHKGGQDFDDAMSDAANAVAAQVLRNLLATAKEREIVVGTFVVTIPTLTDDDLMTFAYERGIDLEGGDA